MARTTYEVIVGNVGRVYRGTSKREADKVYHDYIEISQKGLGRAGGEEVTLFVDGEFADSYVPMQDWYKYEGRPAHDREGNPSGGSDYEIYEGDIHGHYSVVYVGDPKGRYRRKDIQPNGYGYEGGIKPREYASMKKNNRRLSLSDLPAAARATAEKYMGKGRTANPSGPAGIPNAFILLKLHKQPTVDAHGHPIPPRPYSHLLICTFPAYIGHSSYAEWNEYEYLALNPSTGYIEGGRIDEHWMRRYLDGYEKIGKSIGITALPKGSREYAMAFISQQADRIAAWESATPRDQENFARPYHWLRDGGKGR